jgi:radical SAM superfamily enzyme YgiQ (UPF0313 family)
MMRILFCTHDLSYADHISIPYLSAVAKERGHQTAFCTLDEERFSSQSLHLMNHMFRPDVVAYSCNVMGFERLKRHHAAAKMERGFISILGGPQATFSPETFAESGVDAYCVGEGERAFGDFLDCVEVGATYDDVANLITRKGVNPPRLLIGDLDSLPMPDRDITLEYTGLRYVSKRTFYATRGCYWSCAYCANSKYHELYGTKRVRRLSVGRLLAEIQMVQKKYRMDFVKFGDDCFTLKADGWLKEFSEKYPQRIGVPFNCFLRVDTITAPMLELLSNAGCHSVHLSVDSTSPYVREEVLGRRMVRDDLEERIRMVHRFGIKTWVNFMLAAPGSTQANDLDAIRFARESGTTYTHFSTTVPMQGTKLYETALKVLPSGYVGDMVDCDKQSPLTCWSRRDKGVRFNILLLGHLAAKAPWVLHGAMLWLIKHTKPNRFYQWLHDKMQKHYLENVIFKVKV